MPRKNVCKLSMGVYTNASLHGWMIASLVLQCFQVFMVFSNVSSSLYLADLNLLQATCYIVKHTCAVWSLNRFFGFFCKKHQVATQSSTTFMSSSNGIAF